MNGHPPFDPGKDAPLLSAYVDGELDAADVARVEAHLALSAEARRVVAELRRLKELTGALRLKEPPAEEWEAFWHGLYNRAERSLGWLLLTCGVTVLGAWGALQLLAALLGDSGLPRIVKGGVLAGAAGLLILLVSVIRERAYRRARTRYKDVVR